MEAVPAAVASTAATAVPAAIATEEKNTSAVAEGLSILQKVLFLVVISSCVAVYLRMSRVKEEDIQKYEKIIA